MARFKVQGPDCQLGFARLLQAPGHFPMLSVAVLVVIVAVVIVVVAVHQCSWAPPQA